MSNQKRLSRLSFAVIALLAAALPCLAQTEAGKARNSQAADLNPGHASEIAALGNERLSVHKASKTADVRITEKQGSLARARFEQSIEQAATASPAFGTNPTAVSESDWQKTRRLSNDNESISPKRITFVPSRGQRLPQS